MRHQKKLLEGEIILEKMEEHLAKGTSIRSRQEWDINAYYNKKLKRRNYKKSDRTG